MGSSATSGISSLGGSKGTQGEWKAGGMTWLGGPGTGLLILEKEDYVGRASLEVLERAARWSLALLCHKEVKLASRLMVSKLSS